MGGPLHGTPRGPRLRSSRGGKLGPHSSAEPGRRGNRRTRARLSRSCVRSGRAGPSAGPGAMRSTVRWRGGSARCTPEAPGIHRRTGPLGGVAGRGRSAPGGLPPRDPAPVTSIRGRAAVSDRKGPPRGLAAERGGGSLVEARSSRGRSRSTSVPGEPPRKPAVGLRSIARMAVPTRRAVSSRLSERPFTARPETAFAGGRPPLSGVSGPGLPAPIVRRAAGARCHPSSPCPTRAAGRLDECGGSGGTRPSVPDRHRPAPVGRIGPSVPAPRALASHTCEQPVPRRKPWRRSGRVGENRPLRFARPGPPASPSRVGLARTPRAPPRLSRVHIRCGWSTRASGLRSSARRRARARRIETPGRTSPSIPPDRGIAAGFGGHGRGAPGGFGTWREDVGRAGRRGVGPNGLAPHPDELVDEAREAAVGRPADGLGARRGPASLRSSRETGGTLRPASGRRRRPEGNNAPRRRRRPAALAEGAREGGFSGRCARSSEDEPHSGRVARFGSRAATIGNVRSPRARSSPGYSPLPDRRTAPLRLPSRARIRADQGRSSSRASRRSPHRR